MTSGSRSGFGTTHAARRAPRLVVSLRKRKNGSGGRAVASRRVGKLKAGASKRYTIKVKLPRGLAAGRYYVSVCARTAGRPSCRMADRRLRVLKRSQKPPKPPGPKPDDKRADVLVLTESRTAGDAHSSTAAGLDALKDAGKSAGFKVADVAESAGAFTEASLESYRVVVFLNTSGDILSDNEQSAFEHYFQQGGGFVAIHSAITTEADWDFMDELLGTRAEPGTPPVSRVDSAGGRDQGRRPRPRREQVAGRAVRGHGRLLQLARHLGRPRPAARAGDGRRGLVRRAAAPRRRRRSPGHVVPGLRGRPLVLHGRRPQPGHLRRPPTSASNLAGAIKWAAGLSDPVYSDCGATVLANYKQVKISAPPNLNEPIGFDQLPDGRIIQTARAGQVRLHDPRGGTTTVLTTPSEFPQGVYTHSEDGLYGPAVDNELRAEQVGVPLLRAGGREERPAVGRVDRGRDHDPHRPRR